MVNPRRTNILGRPKPVRRRTGTRGLRSAVSDLLYFKKAAANQSNRGVELFNEAHNLRSLRVRGSTELAGTTETLSKLTRSRARVMGERAHSLERARQAADRVRNLRQLRMSPPTGTIRLLRAGPKVGYRLLRLRAAKKKSTK